jgi:hypothetical protein
MWRVVLFSSFEAMICALLPLKGTLQKRNPSSKPMAGFPALLRRRLSPQAKS